MECYGEALDVIESIPDPSTGDFLTEASWSFNLGRLLVRMERLDEAERRLMRAHELHGEYKPDDLELQMYSHSGLGELEEVRGDLDAAIEHYVEADRCAQHAFPADSIQRAATANRLGAAYLARGDVEEAEGPTLTALEIARDTYEPGSFYLDIYLLRRLDWCFEGGAIDEAHELVFELEDTVPEGEAGRRASVKVERARLLHVMGEVEEARRCIREAIPSLLTETSITKRQIEICEGIMGEGIFDENALRRIGESR
ncbi:MAG: tetratricopeptide repeat protein [Planctomycetota bacterium]